MTLRQHCGSMTSARRLYYMGCGFRSPVYIFAIARRLYSRDTEVMEMLLRSLYGATAVIAVPWRSWRCRGDPTTDWSNTRWHCGSFEHVQSVRCATAQVRGFDSFPRCYGDQLRNHCGTTAIMAVPLRCMPNKHRSGTALPV